MRVNFVTNAAGPAVIHTCPHCGVRSRFDVIGSDVGITPNHICGQRACPACKGHLFVAFEDGVAKHAYPPLRLNFDTKDIPPKIAKTLSEALDCHSHSYFIAAAILVRRTLEEIYADRSAHGKDLKERVKDLRNKVILPPELFDAMDELRILGNDAAHVEAKSYDDIGTEQLGTAIEFTKEILKGVYQYKGLLAKLQALKNTPASATSTPSGKATS